MAFEGESGELAQELEAFWRRWFDPESPDYVMIVLAKTEDWMMLKLCEPDLRFLLSRASGCVSGALWETKHILVWANGWCPDRWGLDGVETSEEVVAAAQARTRAVSEVNASMFPPLPGEAPAPRRDPEGPGEINDLAAAICKVVGDGWSQVVAAFDEMLRLEAVLARAAAGSARGADLRDALVTRIRAALDDSRRYAREFSAIGDPETKPAERQRRYEELWARSKDRTFVTVWERARQVDSSSRPHLE